MFSSKSLSISDSFFTSPSPNIWLLLLLPVLPDQGHQVSLTFGLGYTLFHGGISSSPVCVIVLRHLSCFWASGTAVEPRSSTEVCLTWGGPCRNRHQCGAPASIGAFLVKVTPGFPWGTRHFLPWALPHHGSWCSVPPHHPSPSEGGFPEQQQPPPRVGPHRDGCVQTHLVTSHFLFVWRSRQRLEDVEAHRCQVCHGGRRVMEKWT